MMRTGTMIITVSIFLFLWGCEKHDTAPEISLEDAAMLLIEESTDGVGVYGMDLTTIDTLSAEYPIIFDNPIDWAADWHGFPHRYSVDFDTVTDRSVPDLRGAFVTIRDTFQVTFSLLFDADSVFAKENYAVAGGAGTSALLVQLGSYGSLYHGWVLRKIAHRRFRGPSGISPELRQIDVTWGSQTWTLGTNLFSVDDVPEFAPGDSATVRVRTDNPNDLLFLNIHDGSAARRIPMNYDDQAERHIAGWRISLSAPTRRFFQAFIEGFSPTCFTSMDSSAVGIAGHTFVYRIK